MNERQHKSLLPEFIKKPILMLWGFILPQVILLGINLYAYWLIVDEVDPGARHVAYSILAAELGLLAVEIFVWLYSWARKQLVSLPWNAVFLLTHIGYLWYFSSSFWRVIPSAVEPWILDQGMLIFSQFTFIMPGLFYAALRLACFDLKVKKLPDFAVSLLMAILAPLTYYVFFLVLMPFMYRRTMHFPAILSIILFIGTTVIAVAGLIRLIVMAYNLIKCRGDLTQTIFAALIAVVAPLGGLLLNRLIPFPADFQSSWVYVLAIINGLIVTIPVLKKADGHGYLLFGRSVTYPFTFYFFLVFLPFLPLSLPAMFAVGSGFLILVPLALFLLHTKRIYEDFQIAKEAHGVVLSMVLLVVGFSILPAYFTYEAVRDKRSLKSALTYVYSSDISKETRYEGDVKSLKRTLINLKEFKEGIQLPYLSGLYNQIVFEGMVLPDTKMDYLYRLFVGAEMPKPEEIGALDFYGLVGRRSGRRGWGGAVTRPQRNRRVELTSYSIDKQEEKGITKAKVYLTMKNLSDSNTAEFARTIYLPQSVLITDFSLKVENEMVKGKIFEKRAALWVYHMIRDFTRRDPGVLAYKSPTRVDLNVYPFLRKQVRQAMIEFSYPQGSTPAIYIGDEPVLEGENFAEKDAPVYALPASPHQTIVVLSRDSIKALPTVEAKGYLHFILDYSQAGQKKTQSYSRRIADVVQQYQGETAGFMKMTAANFNLQDITSDFIPVNDAASVQDCLGTVTLNPEGGLNVERVIKSVLMQPQQAMKIDGKWAALYPIFVVISQPESEILDLKDMDFYQDRLPFTNEFFVSRGFNQIEAKPLWINPPKQLADKMLMIQDQGRIAFVPAQPNQPFVLNGALVYMSKKFRVLNPETHGVETDSSVRLLYPDTEYAQGLKLKFANQELLYNPELFEKHLDEIVKTSRRIDVMAQSTSFIIVERSSQWKTLQVKERERLNTSEGLEFEEDFNTPSPSLYLLLILFLVWWMGRKRNLKVKLSSFF